jgi:hypothetical protein
VLLELVATEHDEAARLVATEGDLHELPVAQVESISPIAENLLASQEKLRHDHA